MSEPPQPSSLFPTRINSFTWVEWAVLAVYTAILLWIVPRHEPWADEAQAWLLARSAPFADVFNHLLRYEGTPALWAFLLFCLFHLHGSYAAMHWLSAAVALSGVIVWLRYGPFPRAIRWMLPFTFFLQYQYAVVARSYVLFPLLAFALCAELRRRPPRPVIFAILAGLMANVSLHGALFSLAMACLYLSPLRSISGIPSVSGTRVARFHFIAAAILLALAWAGVLWTVRLPSDHAGMAGLVGKAVAHDVIPFKAAALNELILFASVLTYPISNWNAIALPFLILTIAYVWRRGRPLALLPWALILALSLVARVGEYHTGMLWLSLVCALWIVWPENFALHWPERAVCGALAVVLALQIGWTVSALARDGQGAYSAEQALSAFLRPYVETSPNVDAGGIVGLHYQTIGATAFFPSRIYANQPTQYWNWSIAHDVDRSAEEALRSHPRIAVVGIISPGSEALLNQWTPMVEPAPIDRFDILPLAQRYGYRETHRFCGSLVMRFGISEEQCDIVLEPEANSRPALSTR